MLTGRRNNNSLVPLQMREDMLKVNFKRYIKVTLKS